MTDRTDSLPQSERCVSMITFKERILIATETHIYELKRDRDGQDILVKLLFRIVEE